MEEITILKVSFFFVLLVEGILFAFLPILFRQYSHANQQRYLSILNAFSSGIFLATGFVHLLFESFELWDAWKPDIDFPYAAVLAGLGALLIFFLEKVIFSTNHHHDELPLTNDETEKGGYGTKQLETDLPVENNQSTKEDRLTAYLLALMLGVHSFLVGTTLGIQSDTDVFLSLITALLIHKLCEALALGIALTRKNVPMKKFVVSVLSYGWALPLGIFIGAVLTVILEGEAADGIEAVATAIGAGTFIYIALVDLMLPEFENNQDKYIKFGAVCLGFGLITLLTLVFEHDHSGDHSGHDH